MFNQYKFDYLTKQSFFVRPAIIKTQANCEGQTEEAFVREILRPYFWQLHLQLIPIICMTKRTGAGKQKGGITDYTKVKAELTRICLEHSRELVTTMFDYYGLPGNTPGINCHEVNVFVRANYIEHEIEKDIGAENLFVNLVVHEFEGLLFSPRKLSKTLPIQRLSMKSDKSKTRSLHLNI